MLPARLLKEFCKILLELWPLFKKSVPSVQTCTWLCYCASQTYLGFFLFHFYRICMYIIFNCKKSLLMTKFLSLISVAFQIVVDVPNF